VFFKLQISDKTDSDNMPQIVAWTSL